MDHHAKNQETNHTSNSDHQHEAAASTHQQIQPEPVSWPQILLDPPIKMVPLSEILPPSTNTTTNSSYTITPTNFPSTKRNDDQSVKKPENDNHSVPRISMSPAMAARVIRLRKKLGLNSCGDTIEWLLQQVEPATVVATGTTPAPDFDSLNNISQSAPLYVSTSFPVQYDRGQTQRGHATQTGTDTTISAASLPESRQRSVGQRSAFHYDKNMKNVKRYTLDMSGPMSRIVEDQENGSGAFTLSTNMGMLDPVDLYLNSSGDNGNDSTMDLEQGHQDHEAQHGDFGDDDEEEDDYDYDYDYDDDYDVDDEYDDDDDDEDEHQDE